ncbi:hypothetical protein B0I35DRAFT_474128 [Stachybotrys elegans]|uniref:Uncharacterized protein n=1 Tax=Stachybotrys elegans TaxID=80388 RepID=A0A8K0T0M6_9HYPO|nr:hypothetical protein B0I35DRAFT_474128 [Stachybotrys elegans]
MATRFDKAFNGIHSVLRLLGYFSSLAAFLIQAYTIQRWSSQVAASMPGLVASIFAMLNDSLQLASRATCWNRRLHVPALSRTATILWDVAALLISAGDLLLPLAFSLGSGPLRDLNEEQEDPEPWQRSLERAGMAGIGALAAFRFVLICTLCFDRERARRRAERTRLAATTEAATTNPA